MSIKDEYYNYEIMYACNILSNILFELNGYFINHPLIIFYTCHYNCSVVRVWGVIFLLTPFGFHSKYTWWLKLLAIQLKTKQPLRIECCKYNSYEILLITNDSQYLVKMVENNNENNTTLIYVFLAQYFNILMCGWFISFLWFKFKI